MQSAAANMNMWKNTMGLSMGHNFLPATDMSSFTANWSNHGGNHLGHQAAPQMTHHILDSQHLIGYPQHSHHTASSHHQRSLSHLPNHQELVGATLKSQAEQATSFMLNSINHQVNVSQNHTSTNSSIHPQANHHHSTQTTAATTTTTPNTDNLNQLRTIQSVDHSVTSYNLALNDNHQFYNSTNSRNDSNRSQTNSVKPPPPSSSSSSSS